MLEKPFFGNQKNCTAPGWHWMVLGGLFVLVIVISYLSTIRFHREYLRYSGEAPITLMRGIESGEAKVVLDFGNGTKRVFVGAVGDGMTLRNVMRQIERVTPLPDREPLDFSVEGTTIAAVGGIRNSANRQWQAYSGDVLISDPTMYRVKEREEIMVKYEQL